MPPDLFEGDRTDDVTWAVNYVSFAIFGLVAYPYFARDWQEQNSSLFQALKLEKLGMSVILLLIVIVAAFNIVSTLTMVVTDKTREIGILKAMGLPARSVRRIFFLQGLVIGRSLLYPASGSVADAVDRAVSLL